MASPSCFGIATGQGTWNPSVRFTGKRRSKRFSKPVIETSAFSIIQSKHDTRVAELRVTSSRKSENVSSLIVVLLVRAAVGPGPIPMADLVVEYEARCREHPRAF